MLFTETAKHLIRQFTRKESEVIGVVCQTEWAWKRYNLEDIPPFQSLSQDSPKTFTGRKFLVKLFSGSSEEICFELSLLATLYETRFLEHSLEF